MQVKIINESPFPNPFYSKDGDAGMDLKADLSAFEQVKMIGEVFLSRKEETGQEDAILLYPDSRCIIPTNIFIQLPKGYEAQIRPRSGQSFKKGFTVANAPGTIDSNYTGNVGVILANNTKKVIRIEHGERIAQMVVTKHEVVEWENVSALGETNRGSGGFGHTGVK
jgi:dUTP pyrophosphatase